jgi:AraC-like DNA-binding protein
MRAGRRRKRAGELPVVSSGRSVRFAVSVLRSGGHAVEDVLARAGLHRAILEDPEARMSHATVLAFWAEAVKATGDEGLGLHLGQQVRPAAFDALGYVFRTSATLGDGLGRLARYHRFIDEALSLEVEVEGPWARIVVGGPRPTLVSRAVAEFQLAALLQAARTETDTPLLDPAEVEFAFPAPADAGEYRHFFRAPVRFSRAHNALRLARSHLDRPLRGAEAELREVLERHVRDVMARLPARQGVSDRARSVVGEELPHQKPSVSELGRRLGLSERSLHRRLRAEGTSFRELLERVRREQSERHLRAGVPVVEAAFLVGYSDASAFHRSFKRWTGRTPDEYRREAEARPGRAG